MRLQTTSASAWVRSVVWKLKPVTAEEAAVVVSEGSPPPPVTLVVLPVTPWPLIWAKKMGPPAPGAEAGGQVYCQQPERGV